MEVAKASRNRRADKLYFIAIVPPSPIYEDAFEQKVYFKTKYNSKASLNSPPHITLHMPFKWKENDEGDLETQLDAFTRGRSPIKVQLKGFSSFPPKVIFINVEISAELRTLQRDLERHFKRELNLFNAKYKDLAFHPHLTLAFRDLKKPNFQKAWEEFVGKNYEATFLADKVALLKHSGTVWEVFREFEMRD